MFLHFENDYYSENDNFRKTNATCKYGKSKSNTKTDVSKRIKFKIAITTAFTKNALAKVTKLKKKTIWKKYKTFCAAAVRGGGCGYSYGGGSDYFDVAQSSSAKSVTAIYYLNKKADKFGSLYGDFSGADGITKYNYVLTW